MLRWNDIDTVKREVNKILNPITMNDISVKFTDLHQQAMQMMREMETNSRTQVINAMNQLDGYDYGGSWSDHWYECPNGHPYFIGECGGAMQISTCIECGEDIGGEGHHLLETNRSMNPSR